MQAFFFRKVVDFQREKITAENGAGGMSVRNPGRRLAGVRGGVRQLVLKRRVWLLFSSIRFVTSPAGLRSTA
jgi:hypothetical protein